MNVPLLDIKGICKHFDGLKALDNVSFSVDTGELLGIAGPNGSGKSTLFNVLTHIPFGPTAGEVYFRQQRIDRLPAHRISALGLARTFQKDAEFPDLSARETVAVSGVYGANLAGKIAYCEADDTLNNLGFDMSRASIPTTELSVYERKQTMIASALIMRPRVLMLDEPASGLTRPEIAALDQLLVNINSAGVTVILIEHVLSLLLSVAKRLIVLNQGQILAEGTPQAVIQDPAVIEAYLGKRTA